MAGQLLTSVNRRLNKHHEMACTCFGLLSGGYSRETVRAYRLCLCTPVCILDQFGCILAFAGNGVVVRGLVLRQTTDVDTSAILRGKMGL